MKFKIFYNTLRALCLGIVVNVFYISLATAADGLTIKAFLLRETQACAPSGYGKKSCNGWTAADAEKIFTRSPIFSEFNIPPGSTIQLGGLRQTIENYVDISCSGRIPCNQKASQRNSIMLLFEWEEPQSGEIVFNRLENHPIKSYKAGGHLNSVSRWVNHQRAEYFLPRYGFSWELILGSNRWELSAQ